MITRELPYSTLRIKEAVQAALLRKDRPARHPQTPDWLWGLMQRCWNEDPESRPTVDEIIREMDQFVVRSLYVKSLEVS
jgi:hypothetical protein